MQWCWTDVARVTVGIPGLLARFTEGDHQTSLEAATLGDCLHRLVERHPALEPHLFDGSGRLRDHLLLVQNGTMVDWSTAETVEVAPGDTVTILQAVSGG